MAKVVGKEDTEKLLKEKSRGGRKKEVINGKEIDGLKKGGGGVFVSLSEWEMKQDIPNYYYSKYNKGGKKVISCNKVKHGGKEGFLITKV